MSHTSDTIDAVNGQVGPPPVDPARVDPDQVWAPPGATMTTAPGPPPPPGAAWPPTPVPPRYYGPPPAPPQPEPPQKQRTVLVWAVIIAAVLLAIAAVVISVIRWSAPTPVASTTTVTAPAPTPRVSPEDAAAAKAEACQATKTADGPLTSSQHDFLATLANRGSDEYKQALSNFQTVAMVEIEYMRGHLKPATPPEVASPINTYLDALTAVVDADTRELPDADANKVIDAAKNAGQRVTEVCG